MIVDSHLFRLYFVVQIEEGKKEKEISSECPIYTEEPMNDITVIPLIKYTYSGLRYIYQNIICIVQCNKRMPIFFVIFGP